MAHLIPEQRTDKNGRVVTRHVRSQRTRGAGREIPALVSSTASLLEQFEKSLPPWGSSLELIPRIQFIASSNPEVFKAVAHSYLASGEEERGLWSVILYEDDVPDEVDETHYRRMIELVPITCALLPGTPAGYKQFNLGRYADDAEAMVEALPGEEGYDRVKAFIAINAIEKRFPDWQDRQGDLNFIASNFESVIPVIPQLLDRKVASETFIRDLWANGSQAMNDGVL